MRKTSHAVILLLAGCGSTTDTPVEEPREDPVQTEAPRPVEITAGRAVEPGPEERYFASLRQLTFGGQNAEAYWSPDGRKLIFQATRGDAGCDQEYILDLTTGEETRISNGEGRTTCGYFAYPEPTYIVYSSTHHRDPACPARPDHSQGYVWPLNDLDIFRAQPDGSGLVNLTNRDGYDAEATIRFDGGRIVFTSNRDQDLEIYSMAPDGSDVRRVTNAPGYDGGAFYSPDGTRLVWRANRPEGDALADYRRLLGQNLVRPTRMEIYVAGADGSNPRQVTDNGAANFAPYFLPDNRRVIFASNVGENPREFELYMIDSEAEERPFTRVTHSPEFDGFPMFSPDGRHVVFASNRHGSVQGETNLFVAEWRE